MADEEVLPTDENAGIESGVTDSANTEPVSTEPGAAEQPNAPAVATEGDPLQRLEADIVAVLQTIYDPEVPVDIYEMGLIYEVDVRPAGVVFVKMTLTSPSCPVAETLPPEVETKVRGVKGVSNVTLDLVWDPPWHPDMMSEAARLELNI